MKKLIVVGVVVVVVVAAAMAIYYIASNLNSLVAAAIEKHGSDVTETRVKVSGVDISLREGRGSITDLHVANPEGFKSRDAFSLGDITVDIDLGSVREDPVVIDEVRIRAPVVFAELTETGDSNIDEIRKRIQAHTAGTGGSSGGDGGEKNIRITKFVFEKGRIEVDATALGIEKRTIELPEIYLQDVGGKNGAPPDQVAKLIFTEVAKKVGSEIANSEVDRLIEDQLGESLSDKAKGLLDKIGD